jgi:hypothetical protein
LQDTPFFEEKTGENHGIPGDVMVLICFNVFQWWVWTIGSSYLDSEIEWYLKVIISLWGMVVFFMVFKKIDSHVMLFLCSPSGFMGKLRTSVPRPMLIWTSAPCALARA